MNSQNKHNQPGTVATAYVCACGFESTTAVDMHKHLTTAMATDTGQRHYLESSFGLANRHAPQQQADTRSRGGNAVAASRSGNSTPNSLHGFTPVSPMASCGGEDAAAQAWETVEPPHSHTASRQQQQQQQQQQFHQVHHQQVDCALQQHPVSRNARTAAQQDSAHATPHMRSGATAVPRSAGGRPTAAAHDHTQPEAAHSSSRAAHQQQQQQQQVQMLQGAHAGLGVQLMAGNASFMAAMSGWVVDQAISAAATTAAATLVPPAPPPAPPSVSPQFDSSNAAELPGSSGGSSSWWRRFSRSSEQAAAAGTAAAAAAAAGDGPVPTATSKGSLRSVAKRHSLRKRASVAAASAAGGAAVQHASTGPEDSEGSACGGDASGSEGVRSDSSMEYSQLLSAMDSELRVAAAAGAAAAVAEPQPGRFRTAMVSSGAGAGASGAVDDFDDVNLDAELCNDGDAGAGASSSWLAAIGLAPGTSGSDGRHPTAAAAVVVGRGKREGYLLVDHDTGSALAERAKVLRHLLLWRSPGASVKALLLGIYVILLLSNLPRALDYMQVTTVLPGLALLCLTYNFSKPWAIRLYCSTISPASDARQLQARLMAAEESAAKAVVWCAAKGAVEAGGWTLACLALAHRALRARRFTTSCWTFVALWLLLLVSELRIINQTLLAMAAYAGLFSVPWLYKQFRHVIDRVVYDTMHFLTLLLVNAERWAYGVAFLAAAVVWHLLEPTDSATSGASFVVRCTAAALAGFAVLMWRLMVTE